MSAARGATRPADALVGSTYQQFFPDSAAATTTLPVRTVANHQDNADHRQHHSRAENDSRLQQSSRHDGPPSSSRSHRSRNTPAASRSATAVGQTPIDTLLPRENSAIINHIVVDDPRSDLERERARTYEARPYVAPGPSERPRTHDATTSDPPRRSRQEFHHTSGRKEVKFGEYILGQTLGEGEFGKVKMGWKKDSSVQVAIKLIRKESLAGNATRLPKIYREISILRDLEHPNIVRLHEFVETERHMGIILEYASGGELFDYILNQRYLRDDKARKLFAQLISGVGYLHQKGIVHRDLKLENLLLDRNKNIIITDFGFANTFNPDDELGESVERRITDKEFVKREGLNIVGPDNHRRGDLMQTSCGSPCYAAPELVVSDGLYTGRKVDVWSCGVILYAMLAGYLPFDDDPANPEGDNINLLYKYIVSTPLSFPEYVTPHARDLLRRILVPDPRKRADLFEVARHSWLSDYMHVVGFIGSTKADAARMSQKQEPKPLLGRSASVREPSTRSPQVTTPKTPAEVAETAAEARKQQRDAKRRTVQLEYVPPQPRAGKTETRNRQGPQVPQKDPMSPPTRTHSQRGQGYQAPGTASRPNTGGALGGTRLPSRGNSYGQPVVATPTTENAQGFFSRPKSGSGYMISNPTQVEHGGDGEQDTRPLQPPPTQNLPSSRGHKRSTTLSNIGDRLMGRSNSRRSKIEPSVPEERKNRRYPPVSMNNAMQARLGEETTPRPSTDSRRRPSFSSFMRKPEGPAADRRNSKRFSLLPGIFGRQDDFGRNREMDGGLRSRSPSDPTFDDFRMERGMSVPLFPNSYSRPSPNDTTATSPPLGQNFDSYPSRYYGKSETTPDVRHHRPYEQQQAAYTADDGYGYPANNNNNVNNNRMSLAAGSPGSGSVGGAGLQMSRPQRRFENAYDQGHGGSSSGARRVMDFFRRRGKDRSQL
ncbi:Pkinase-domain-containing protein [Piedraia hortae CBS 480.64]|uniref:non-specific serine/threonine protein kinase n=1 Tax=Piedraia hortae CBS 480.64 TaxID=1314780 RepID=A0A6A7BWD7_9PEZI|nr:Pkinase-domain-containing protein [Piedraia hortae CBS 480.64]